MNHEPKAEVEARLLAQAEALELREAQLEAAIGRGAVSPEVLAELQQVRIDLEDCLEGLDVLGYFDPPDESSYAASTSCS